MKTCRVSKTDKLYVDGIVKPVNKCKIQVRHKITGEIMRVYKWDKKLLEGIYYTKVRCKRTGVREWFNYMYEDEFNQLQSQCSMEVIHKQGYVEFDQI